MSGFSVAVDFGGSDNLGAAIARMRSGGPEVDLAGVGSVSDAPFFTALAAPNRLG